MFKKWLVALGMAILITCAFQLLWASGGGKESGGDEHPWNGATGGTTVGTATAKVTVQTVSATVQFYIVRPAPTGGFYLMRISLPSWTTTKTAAGAKKVGN